MKNNNSKHSQFVSLSAILIIIFVCPIYLALGETDQNQTTKKVSFIVENPYVIMVGIALCFGLIKWFATRFINSLESGIKQVRQDHADALKDIYNDIRNIEKDVAEIKGACNAHRKDGGC